MQQTNTNKYKMPNTKYQKCKKCKMQYTTQNAKCKMQYTTNKIRNTKYTINSKVTGRSGMPARACHEPQSCATHGCTPSRTGGSSQEGCRSVVRLGLAAPPPPPYKWSTGCRPEIANAASRASPKKRVRIMSTSRSGSTPLQHRNATASKRRRSVHLKQQGGWEGFMTPLCPPQAAWGGWGGFMAIGAFPKLPLELRRYE
jgi:hypothetical protein